MRDRGKAVFDNNVVKEGLSDDRRVEQKEFP